MEFIPPLIVNKKNLKENSAREYNIMPLQRKERICRQAGSDKESYVRKKLFKLI